MQCTDRHYGLYTKKAAFEYDYASTPVRLFIISPKPVSK